MVEDVSNSNYNEIERALSPITRQLDRLDERTRDIATRSDLESLRKELVTRDAFEPQLNLLKNHIVRVDEERDRDKTAAEKRFDKIENEQLSRQDRLWIRMGQIVGVLAFVVAMFEFLSHYKFTP